MNRWIKLGLFGLMLIGLLLGVRQLPVNEWIGQLERLLKEMGGKAPALYFVVYIAACIALLPSIQPF